MSGRGSEVSREPPMDSAVPTITGRTAGRRDLSVPRTGRFVLRDDPDWDLARKAWNLAADQRPSAVALPESPDEVRSIVDRARARGLRIAPQATGHGALALAPLAETILLRTTRMRGVQIDAVARRARVQAGEVWARS